MIRPLWDKLDKKQRAYVTFGAIFVVAALLFEFVATPLWESRDRAERSISRNTRVLAEMTALEAKLLAQEAELAAARRLLAQRGTGFSLFAYIEQKAVAARLKGSIRQMTSLRGVQTESYEETLVDMRLDRITMQQLTDFLFHVESPADMIRVKRISVSPMKDAPEYLNVGLLVASYTPASPQGGR